MRPWQEGVYYVLGATALVCMLLTTIFTNMVATSGATMALKGEHGSLRKAVDNMKRDRNAVQHLFYFGTIAFGMAFFVLLWDRPVEVWVKAICSFIAAMGLVCGCVISGRVSTRYAFVETADARSLHGQGVVNGTDFVRIAKVAESSQRSAAIRHCSEHCPAHTAVLS